MKKLLEKFDRINNLLAKNMVVTVIAVAVVVSLATASVLGYARPASKLDVNTVQNETVNESTQAPTQTASPTSLPALPAPSVATSPIATPKPTVANKPDCIKYNNDMQAIVNSSLTYAYGDYQAKKNTIMADATTSDTAKENAITYAYTSYQWKVENWQSDLPRKAREIGCTSTAVATLLSR